MSKINDLPTIPSDLEVDPLTSYCVVSDGQADNKISFQAIWDRYQAEKSLLPDPLIDPEAGEGSALIPLPTQQIKLGNVFTWDIVPGASSYQVSYRKNGTSEFEVATTSSTSFTVPIFGLVDVKYKANNNPNSSTLTRFIVLPQADKIAFFVSSHDTSAITTLSGGVVTAVQDLSQSGASVVRAGVSQTPKLVTVGGQPGFDFETGLFIASAPLTISASQMFVTLKGPATDSAFWYSRDINGGAGLLGASVNNTNTIASSYGDINQRMIINNAFLPNASAVYEITHMGSSGLIRRDATEVGTNSSSYPSQVATAGFTLGGKGGTPSSEAIFHSYLLYANHTQITGTELIAVRGALASLAGIS